ncbi:MAG: hypothetical protein RLZZ227_1588 [Pseudomonadota bacterium]
MELAIVLMIVGTLMSGVLVAVSQGVTNGRIADARAQLREIEEALYGYAEAYGRLPCPATDASLLPGFEDAACTEMHGFVPVGTLGLSGPVNNDGLLVDPWQNPLRYSLIVDEIPGQTPAFSQQASIQTFFNNSTPFDNTSNAALFKVCGDVACAETISDVVPAVIMSLGANGASYSSSDESTNAGDQIMGGYDIKDDYIFVSTTYSEENFDDQVLWLSPYVLFNRLTSAGKLP